MLKIFGFLLFIAFSVAQTMASVKSDLDGLTGNTHTRVVWLRGGDRITGGGDLMGFDSKLGTETKILTKSALQNRPIICSGGHRVVVSIDYKVYVVNWDGSGKKHLVDGFASDVWVDDKGKEWVIVRTGGKSTGGDVYRYELDNPSSKVLLWDKGRVGIDYMPWWQLSADGNYAAEFLPWSKGYLIENAAWQKNGTATELGDGCWSSMAPDNSHIWFHLTCCPHKTLVLFNKKNRIAEFNINASPIPSGYKTDEFYHPKFASHGGRFLTVTGGYSSNSGSKGAEIYLGKFKSDFKGFDGWVRLTNNSESDYTADAWVGVGDAPVIEPPDPPKASSIEVTPAEATVATGATVQLSAVVLDQFGAAMKTQPSMSWKVGSGGGSIDGSGLYTAGNEAGAAVVEASATGLKATATLAIFAKGQLHLKVNAGHEKGAVTGWDADTEYLVDGKKGQAFAFSNSVSISGVSNAAPAELYKTVRHTDHAYSFGQVPNGTYLVRFHFNDGVGGGRSMRYIVEGKTVIDNFSIVNAAGGSDKAYVKDVQVIVSDGNGLQIECDKASGNDVFEAGIEIIQTGGTAEPDNIVISSPAAGGTWMVGEEARIRWNAPQDVTGVTVDISVDKGENWLTLAGKGSVNRDDSNWGDFFWTVPAEFEGIALAGKTAVVRVADYFAADTYLAVVNPGVSIQSSNSVNSRPGLPEGLQRTEWGFRWSLVGRAVVAENRGESGEGARGRIGVNVRLLRLDGSELPTERTGSAITWDLSRESQGLYVLQLRGPGLSESHAVLWTR